jgi:hypothetical protein
MRRAIASSSGTSLEIRVRDPDGYVLAFGQRDAD